MSKKGGEKMNRRITILDSLKSKVPSELQPLVSELYEEINDYFFKMDLFFHFSKNVFLFDAIYNKKMTNLEVSITLPIDTKCVTKFVKDTEDFTRNLIATNEKYRFLISYINKK